MLRQVASDGLGIHAANYVDCFTGRQEIALGCRPGGKAQWDPALGVLIDVLSGKSEVPQPVPEGAGPSQLLSMIFCISRKVLEKWQRERWALREGETLRPRKEVLLTDDLIMMKRCTSQVRRKPPPLEVRKRKENCQGHVLAGCLIPELGKSGFTIHLGLTFLLAVKGIKV